MWNNDVPQSRRRVSLHQVMNSTAQNFWKKVKLSDASGCWLWMGAKHSGGYGQLWNRSSQKVEYAHRLSYELLVGTIPGGLTIDHLCRNRICVNPHHLEPVTRHENWRRGESVSAVYARATHCRKGHELTPENISSVKSHPGVRWCSTCKRDREKALRDKKRKEYKP